MGSTAERGSKALAAMKELGFTLKKAKPIIKRLLRACENNWEHIEAENYRLLVEAILDSDEAEEDPKEKNTNENLDSKKREAPMDEEPELYRKRLRQRQEQQRPSSSIQYEGTSMKIPKVERDDSSPRKFSPEKDLALLSNLRERNEPSMRTEPPLPNTSLRQGNIELPQLHSERQKEEVAVISHPETGSVNGRPKEHSVDTYQRQPSPARLQCSRSHKEPIPSSERAESLRCLKEPKIEPGLDSVSGTAVPMDSDELVTSEPLSFEVPIAIVRPQPSLPTGKEVPPTGHLERLCKKGSLTADAGTTEVTGSLDTQNTNKENGEGHLSVARNKSGTNDEFADAVESSTSVEIASSTFGEAKVSLLYNVSDFPDFQLPSLESILKRVEDRCLRSYKILDSSFSLMNIMKEVCKSVLELGTEPVEDRQEDPIRITPSLDAQKASGTPKLVGGSFAHSASNSFGSQLPSCPGLVAMDGLVCNEQPGQRRKGTDDVNNAMKKRGPEVLEPSANLVVVQQHEPALGAVRPVHDVNDITKGEERVRVSIINEFTSEQCPPHFSYIPKNVVYQNAYMNFSLARIGDEDCCSDCFGDCLSASIPCACARETGGEFAYSLEGVLKKEFLDDCISLNHDPPKNRLFYCIDCPLERSKNEGKPEACKGHLVRKFIKECWSKCGCNKQCGNRVVQRGITCNLQIFFTPERKGWGLRTLDDLPRGAFICEYVGEVLTNMELYERTIRTIGNAKHTYPVLLDADWGSEGVLKDEEALCLDATFYGNVARFINHRCHDANLLEVPVEVETPDHHYYHLAFFTKRKVEAFEELTWDYGIDFDDHDHPIKAFRCLCGSKLCRDMKRPRRRKAGAIVLK